MYRLVTWAKEMKVKASLLGAALGARKPRRLVPVSIKGERPGGQVGAFLVVACGAKPDSGLSGRAGDVSPGCRDGRFASVGEILDLGQELPAADSLQHVGDHFHVVVEGTVGQPDFARACGDIFSSLIVYL